MKRQLSFFLSIIMLSTTMVHAAESKPTATRAPLPIEDLQRFTAVIENIRNYYVNPIEDKPLFENAIHGMLSGLDPHSAYLNPEEFKDLRVNTTGKFGGLGIEVTMEDGFIRIISPIDDTPATKAGLKTGDLIIRLDETPVKGLALRKAVDLMRGAPGSKIILTILRKGENKPLRITVIRDLIRVKSVKTKILDSNYAYVRLSQFQITTGEDMLTAIKILKEEAKSPLKGMILDLRNNPGGILDASIKVSDAFLDRKKLKYDGLIVYTKGRLPKSEIQEKAHEGDILNGAPIVILVNGGSASASEIVAGALQDHGRAIVMGTQSFGKGSVQTVLPLKDNYGLKLTTALYYTPRGRSIQAEGIVPDIIVEEMKMPTQIAEEEVSQGISIKERDLQGHLENANQKKDKLATPEEEAAMLEKQAIKDQEAEIKNKDNKDNKETKESKNKDDKNNKNKEDITAQDYQIREALNLLKGLSIVQSKLGS